MNENRKKIIIYIVLFLLLLAVIFGILAFIQNKSNQTVTNPEPTKNLFGYFTKNKTKTTTDNLSNGTVVVDNTTNTSGNKGTVGTIIGNIFGNNNSANNGTGQNGSTSGTDNNSGTNTTTGTGGTTTFTVGNGTSTTLDVVTDTVTGLPTDTITVGNNTGGGSGLGTSSTTGSGTTGVGTSGTTGGTVTDTQCRDGDTIQYRVSQPQGDVVFAEDGELISDDRVFPPNTLAISALGLWNGSQYKKIKECIPAEDTIDITPFEPITTNQPTEVFDACRILANNPNPSDTEMRDCVLYRTWNVWTYPDNYIKDPSWNEDSINRSQFQAMKTKIRTEFNNITEKISSERSFANTEYDLKSLIKQKQNLYVLEGDCRTLKTRLGLLWMKNSSSKNVHDQIGLDLQSEIKLFNSPDIQNAIKDYKSSMLGTPNGLFKEVNFINTTQQPLATTLLLPDNSFPTLAFTDPAIRGLDVEYGEEANAGKATSLSVYQRRQPQNVFELMTRDAGLNLFCKLTDVSIGYTAKAVGTWQSQGNRLYCDSYNENWKTTNSFPWTYNYTPSKFNPRQPNDEKLNYDINNHNWWYRATPSYLIYKLYKDN